MSKRFSFLIWSYFTALSAIGLLAPQGKIVSYSLQIVVPWVIVLILLFKVLPRPISSWTLVPRATLWVGLYMSWAGLSIFWSDSPNYAFSAAMWSVWVIWCVAVVLTMTANKVSAIFAAMWGIVAGGLLSGFYYVLWSGLTPDATGHRAKDVGMNANQVAIAYWNGLGASTGIATVAALFLLTRTRGWRKALVALLLLILIGCTLDTVSKTSIIATAAASAAFLLADRGPWLRKMGVVVVLLAGALVALPYAMPALRLYGETANVATLTGRTELWSEVLTLIDDAPIIGHGFMWMALHPVRVWAGETHNDILSQLLHFGIIGFAIAAVLYWRLGKRILRCSTQFRSVSVAMLAFCLVRGVSEASDTTIVPLHLVVLLVYASLASGPASDRPPAAFNSIKRFGTRASKPQDSGPCFTS